MRTNNIMLGNSIMPPKLRFTLYYKEESYVLKYMPEGWKDFGMMWKRNISSGGFEREFTRQIRFIKEDGLFLAKAVAESGRDAEVFLKVEVSYPQFAPYRTIFYGKGNFYGFEVQRLYFTCSFDDVGLPISIPAYTNSKYEIPVDTKQILIQDGIYLSNSASFVVAETQHDSSGGGTYVNSTIVVGSTPSKAIFFKNVNSIFDPILKKDGSQKVSMRIKGFFKIFVRDSIPPYFSGDVYLRVSLASGGNLNIIRIYNYFFHLDAVGNEFQINFDEEIEIEEQGEYRLTFSLAENIEDMGNIANLIWVVGPNNTDGTPDLMFDFNASTKPFNFYGLPLKDLLQQILVKINKDDVKIKSNLLTQDLLKDIYVTSGDGIRSFSNAKIKTSFNELITALKCVFCTGFSVNENTFQLEKLEHFYQNTEIFNIGAVNDVTITDASDLLANKFSLGYDENEYDERNGRDEYNVTLNFETNSKSVHEEKKLISPYRADSYGIQFTKYNLEGEITTDSTADNDIFFVHTKNENGVLVVNKDIEILSGSDNKKGVFNAELSPKRNLLRWGQYLASILYKTDGSLTYISSDRYNNLVSKNIDGTIITEKTDVPIDKLGKKLFIPYYLTCEGVSPVGISEISDFLENGTYGYISFKVNGMRLKGFPIEINESIAEKKEQRWLFLLHPETSQEIIVKLMSISNNF